VGTEDVAVVTVVASGPEADACATCFGRRASSAATETPRRPESSLEEFIATGPREILVHPSDLEAARGLLADTTGGEGD
jgi:hypothetical protein